MRLGIDAWGLSSDLYYTGMGQYAARLIRGLTRQSADITVYAYGAPGEPRPEWLPVAVRWRGIGRAVPGKLTALVSRLVFLPAVLEGDAIDLFHVPAVHMRPLFPPVTRWRGPTVATLHDLIPMTYYDLRTLPRRQRIFYRWNLRRAASTTALITVSESSRDEIVRELRVPADRVHAIHNGVDFAPNLDDAPLGRLGVARPYVLYAGSYEPRKNFIGMLTAFAALVARGEQRTLVAIVERSSGHEPLTRALVDRLGPRVRLVHSVADADLRSLYAHADVLVFPSLAEGFGLPPLQAAACGTPVVATDLPVLREILGDAALFIDARDPSEIARGISRVIEDRELAYRLSEAGRRRARAFSEERMTARHAELYETLLPGRQAVAAVSVTDHTSTGGAARAR